MITIYSKAKYKVGGKAPKHGYRTRTGPGCCNGGCSKRPETGSGIKMSARVARRAQQGR